MWTQQGGAVAGIAAALMTKWGVNGSHIVTFGAPKFADEKHIDWLKTNMAETKYLQYVYGNDIVTLLPPSNLKEFGIMLVSIFLLPFHLISNNLGFRKK